MNTPICDFVQGYVHRQALRMHMPGHKGMALLGFEAYDLTEIEGADSLYEADGIILKSENNASALFGCPTFYSTEGSSQCIRAMLHLLMLYAKTQGRTLKIAAARNVHKTFLTAAALQDWDVEWLWPEMGNTYLSCVLAPNALDEQLEKMAEKPIAVYVTSPDYLGNCCDIAALAQVCHKHKVLLAVDNAHGAYLRFLQPSEHPMDLGADVCCDSAHKTLPALTGAAYLHISSSLPPMFRDMAKTSLSMYGSTSPSYLILQSLDAVNAYLDACYSEKLNEFAVQVKNLKQDFTQHGYVLHGDEKMKITIDAKEYGYTGIELAAVFRENNVFCEFCDEDYIVFMVTPETGTEGLNDLKKCMLRIPKRKRIAPTAFRLAVPEKTMSVRQAMMSPCETVNVSSAAGRILSTPSVSCPPAVPIIMCGERIDENTIQQFRYYGIEYCRVVK